MSIRIDGALEDGNGLQVLRIREDGVIIGTVDPADRDIPPAPPSGAIQSVVAGDNVTVDATDPANPIVSATSTASPLTTKGDLFGHSTVDARLGVGANGTILTADSTQALGFKWGTGKVFTAGATFRYFSVLTDQPDELVFYCLVPAGVYSNWKAHIYSAAGCDGNLTVGVAKTTSSPNVATQITGMVAGNDTSFNNALVGTGAITLNGTTERLVIRFTSSAPIGDEQAVDGTRFHVSVSATVA